MINDIYREAAQFPIGVPVVGDRVMCIKNHPKTGIVNGDRATVTRASTIRRGKAWKLDVINDLDEKQVWICDPRGFTGQEGQSEAKSDRKCKEVIATFSYATTAHSSQGGEWPAVAVIDQGSVFREDEHRWRYTAGTRATEKLLMLSPNQMRL